MTAERENWQTTSRGVLTMKLVLLTDWMWSEYFKMLVRNWPRIAILVHVRPLQITTVQGPLTRQLPGITPKQSHRTVTTIMDHRPPDFTRQEIITTEAITRKTVHPPTWWPRVQTTATIIRCTTTMIDSQLKIGPSWCLLQCLHRQCLDLLQLEAVTRARWVPRDQRVLPMKYIQATASLLCRKASFPRRPMTGTRSCLHRVQRRRNLARIVDGPTSLPLPKSKTSRRKWHPTAPASLAVADQFRWNRVFCIRRAVTAFQKTGRKSTWPSVMMDA